MTSEGLFRNAKSTSCHLSDPFQADGLNVYAMEADGGLLYLADIDIVSDGWTGSRLGRASVTEKERAEKYRDPLLGKRFLTSRCLLRSVLSHHSGWAECDLDFRCHALGKAFVENFPLHFNLSRSGKFVAIGLSARAELGVDIEANASWETCRDVADSVLTAGEADACAAASSKIFIDRFLQHWALKEAILKASGEGLSRDMLEIEVNILKPIATVEKVPVSYGLPDSWIARLIDTGIPTCALAYAFKAPVA